MSHIKRLLDEFNPRGVLSCPISDFTKEITARNRDSAVSEVRSVTNSRGLTPTSEIFDNSRTSSNTSNYKIVQPGMFVYNPSRINVGSVAWHRENIPVIVSPMYVVFDIEREKILPEFLMLFLKSSNGRSQIESKTEVGARFRLTYSSLSKMRVPVPHIEIQREIVRVLDTFTDLEADLEEELEARHKQYEYYSGELLSAGPNVPRVKLGDVATVVRGASPRPIQRFLTEDPDGVPWIKIGDVPATGKYITSTRQRIAIEGAERSRRVMPGDFVLSNSMSFGRPYISKIEGYIHDGWLAISGFEESYLSDYLYYLLRSEQVQVEFRRRAGAGTVKNLNSEIVRSVEISLPPRATQEKVVALLDKFDALVNDSSAGIPAELNARRMQYEYYRDRLLTFDEAPL